MSELKAFIYTSKPRVELSDEDFTTLVTNAQTKNKSLLVTGFLSKHNNEYLQYIEGPKNSIDQLVKTISEDERHEMTLTHSFLIGERCFKKWALYSDIIANQGFVSHLDLVIPAFKISRTNPEDRDLEDILINLLKKLSTLIR